MNKYRLEALSDGVFAILMTLLVIELHVPEIFEKLNNLELFNALIALIPKFSAFFLSFIVITMMWVSHHTFMAKFTRVVNRRAVILNAFLLAAVSLIPFSANLIGTYTYNQTAIIWYGLNIILVGIMGNILWYYVTGNDELRNKDFKPKELLQARIRTSLNPLFALLGILVSFAVPTLSYILYAFPVVFNLIPGSLDMLEKAFGIDLERIAEERLK
jgi:uncharacterized membrane protein